MKSLHCDVQERTIQCVFHEKSMKRLDYYKLIRLVLHRSCIFLRENRKTSFSGAKGAVLTEFIKTHNVEVFGKLSPLLHYQLHCSCFISFHSVHTSLIVFHSISFSLQSISFTFTIFGCTHILSLVNLNVSFRQPRLWKLTTYECLR